MRYVNFLSLRSSVRSFAIERGTKIMRLISANQSVRRKLAAGLQARGVEEAVRAVRSGHRVRYHEQMRLRAHADGGPSRGGYTGVA